MSMVITSYPTRVSTATHLAEVTIPGTAAYEEAMQLQTAMYRHVTRSGSRAIEEVVPHSPEHVTLITIYRQGSSVPLCTVKVVRPPETLIQKLVHFAPGSLPACELNAGSIAELGGFVIRPGVERGEIPDILDTLAFALLHLTDTAIATFWLLPRRHLMRLFLAAIPEVLPPYRLGLCHDVLCWNESSAHLHALRETNFRGHHFGLQGMPYIYTISRQAIDQDLVRRMAVVQERRQHPAFVHRFNEAMRQAQQDIQQELTLLNGEGNNDEGHH